jgi:hypothetical protein
VVYQPYYVVPYYEPAPVFVCREPDFVVYRPARSWFNDDWYEDVDEHWYAAPPARPVRVVQERWLPMPPTRVVTKVVPSATPWPRVVEQRVKIKPAKPEKVFEVKASPKVKQVSPRWNSIKPRAEWHGEKGMKAHETKSKGNGQLKKQTAKAAKGKGHR